MLSANIAMGGNQALAVGAPFSVIIKSSLSRSKRLLTMRIGRRLEAEVFDVTEATARSAKTIGLLA
jgi:hypothetical protein